MTEKIVKSLNINLPAHVVRSRDPRAILTTLFAAWLPVSTALLVSVIESLPSPPDAQATRLPALIDGSPGSEHIDPAVRNAMVTSKSSKDDPVVAYVSKMVSIPASELPTNKRKQGSILTPEEAREMGRQKRAEAAKARAADINEGGNEPEDTLSSTLEETTLDEPEKDSKAEHLIGFARLYSGTLSVGDFVYVLPPKFSPANAHAAPEPKKVEVTALYLLMGRGLEPLTSVPAGVVFGIGGLEGHILKSGTLCSQLDGGVNLAGVSMGAPPVVRVALEPANPADLSKMIKGLRLLVQSDPCAEYEQFETGEHVLLTAGELHLERCLTDLRERFAKCEIQQGEPIVPYRESIVRGEEMKPPANKELGRGRVVADSSSKQVTLKLSMRPLPSDVTDFLIKNTDAIKRFYADRKAMEANKASDGDDHAGLEEVEEDAGVAAGGTMSMEESKRQLQELFEAVKGHERETWANAVEHITAFGPRRIGPNLLIDATSNGIFNKL